MPEVHGVLAFLYSGRWESGTRSNLSSARLLRNRAEHIIEWHREVEARTQIWQSSEVLGNREQRNSAWWRGYLGLRLCIWRRPEQA